MKLHYAKAVIREIQGARQDLQTVKLCDDVLKLHAELKVFREAAAEVVEQVRLAAGLKALPADEAIATPEGE